MQDCFRSLSVTLLLLALTPLAAQAELFKWIDSAGKVHYSDKPPAQPARQLPARQILPEQSERPSIKRSFPEKQPQHRQTHGILRPQGSPGVNVFIVNKKNPWRRLDDFRRIGYFAYGKNCTLSRSKKWPDALNDTPYLFPYADELGSFVQLAFTTLDYPSLITDAYNLLKLKRSLGGYSLLFQITDLRYDSCAPRMSSLKAMRRSQYYSGDLKRHRVYLQVEWKLFGQDEQTPLFDAITEGSSDGWTAETQGKMVFNSALLDATAQLLAKRSFVDLISNPQQAAPAAAGEQDEGLKGLVSRWLSPLLQSNPPSAKPDAQPAQ